MRGPLSETSGFGLRRRLHAAKPCSGSCTRACRSYALLQGKVSRKEPSKKSSTPLCGSLLRFRLTPGHDPPARLLSRHAGLPCRIAAFLCSSHVPRRYSVAPPQLPRDAPAQEARLCKACGQAGTRRSCHGMHLLVLHSKARKPLKLAIHSDGR